MKSAQKLARRFVLGRLWLCKMGPSDWGAFDCTGWGNIICDMNNAMVGHSRLFRFNFQLIGSNSSGLVQKRDPNYAYTP